MITHEIWLQIEAPYCQQEMGHRTIIPIRALFAPDLYYKISKSFTERNSANQTEISAKWRAFILTRNLGPFGPRWLWM